MITPYPPEEMNWYYLDEAGQVAGPVSDSSLRELERGGALKDESKVCREGTEDWIRLEDALGSATAETPPFPTTIKFSCPHCGQHISAEAFDAGLSTQCPACGGEISVPHLSESGERTMADRLKEGAMKVVSALKSNSKQAALKARIEKLRNIDLRKAHHTLGKACFDSGTLESELAELLHTIRQLDARIAKLRENGEPEADETKMASLKRIGKDAATTTQAKMLSVKREHAVTDLGRQAHALKEKDGADQLAPELARIEQIESQIESMHSELRELGADGAGAQRKSRKSILLAMGLTGVSAVLIAWAIWTFTRSDNENPIHSASNWGSSSQSRVSTFSAQDYERANRVAVVKFREHWEVALKVNPSGEDGSSAAANILAAIKNTDWNNCSPDLKTAARNLRDLREGATMGEFKGLLTPFMSICDRYE